MNNVYYRKEDMLACINQFYEDMIDRSETMKQHPNYKTGENYAYLGLSANFLIFDEYVAMMDMLGRESTTVIHKLKQIVMFRTTSRLLFNSCLSTSRRKIF